MPFFNGHHRNPLRNTYNFFRYDLLIGIKNLIIYIPVIWIQRDWDYAFLYELMVFKMKRMENCLRFGVAEDRKVIANQIKDTYKAMERLKDEDYFYKKCGRTEFDEEKQRLDEICFLNGMKNSRTWWD